LAYWLRTTFSGLASAAIFALVRAGSAAEAGWLGGEGGRNAVGVWFWVDRLIELVD